METGLLGRLFKNGELIVRQGEYGDCMYVIQSGKVEVIARRYEGKEVVIAELGTGDFFGEMALFEKEVRSASVKALGDVSILTVDKRTLLRRIQQDPSLAFRILEKMSSRIRRLDDKYTRITSSDRRNWETRPEKFVNA